MLPTFNEILNLVNLEERRVALDCFGIQNLINSVKAIRVDKQTLTKKANYIDQNGKLITSSYTDTYELFKIDKALLNPKENKSTRGWRSEIDEVHFVKCSCTSTGRIYLLWVDAQGVKNANGWDSKINAISAIAWTIQTQVPQGKIEKIIRQGDCIFVKPTTTDECRTRHITEEEYRTLMVAES